MDKLHLFQLEILELVASSPKSHVHVYYVDPDRFALHVGPASDLSWNSPDPKVRLISRLEYNLIQELAADGLILWSGVSQPWPGGSRGLYFIQRADAGLQRLATLKLQNELERAAERGQLL